MKNLILLGSFCISFVCLGQENIYPYGRDSLARPLHFVQVGDSVLFSTYVGTSRNSLFTSFQGILDLDGNLMSSSPVAGLNGSMPQEFIGAYSQSRNDSSVFRSWNAFGVTGSITGGNRIDRYNIKMGRRDTFTLVGDSLKRGSHLCTKMVDFGNTIWAGGSYGDSSFSGAYINVFNKNDGDHIFRKYYPNSGVVRDIKKIGQKFVISFSGPGKILEVRDSNFQLDTAYIRPSSYPAGQVGRLYYEVHRIIDDPNSSKYYGLAYFVNSNIAMITYDEDHSITKIDSFLFAPSTEIRPMMFLNAFDYTSADSIFAVGNLWAAQYPGDGFYQPGRTEGFKVMMFDTANTIKWSKIIKKSGLVYEVWGVLALSDGGALIFSRYYDPNYSRRLHSQISVIKIQGDGRILNEQIYDLPQTPALSLHPNPTEGELNLDLPPSQQGQGARYRIYKISGALELEGAYRPGELLDVSALPRGTYLLRMQWDNGTVQKGRFVKK